MRVNMVGIYFLIMIVDFIQNIENKKKICGTNFDHLMDG